MKRLNLSRRFVEMMVPLRWMLDAAGASDRILVITADGSFCNRTVLSAPRDGTEIIARARKDAVLCFPAPQPSRRFYAVEKFTPEQVRQNEAIPWQSAARRPSCLDLITLLRKEMTEHPEMLAPYNAEPSDRGDHPAVNAILATRR